MSIDKLAAVRLDDRTGISLTGKDRMSWLNGLVTCDLTKHAAYGLIVEKKGRIQTDFFVVETESALLLAVPKNLRDQIVETLDHYLIMEDVELALSDRAFWLLVGGEKTNVLGIGEVVALDPSETPANAIDEAAWEALRIQRGIPRFGVEFDATLYPQEAGLEKLAVSFDKGCYLGQEVVYMLENRGHVKRKLVPLDLDGLVATGDAVTTPEGAAVGEVKSATSGAAIAMVKWAQTKPGTELRVGERVARVR